MNIVMMTNTYKPIIGGLEKSVEYFSEEYRKRGHKVLIVSPEYEDAPEEEKDVFRVPAIQNFNGTDFSVELPVPNHLTRELKQFKPDIVHSHHPFLIGDTALRVAAEFKIPIVFTHHTLYEENTHYVPGDSKALKKFVIRLSTGYANLCDRVIAPSESVARMIKRRGVKTPVHVIPTGIYLKDFQKGDGKTFRKFFDIPQNAFLIGLISRVAPEKNVMFLARSVAEYLKENENAWFVIVGKGPSLEDVQQFFERNKLGGRVISTGVLKDKQLASAYAALDVFAFASHSETQGLVLVEAMSAGTPVVAVDAPGVREVVEDQKNGRLVSGDNQEEFAAALDWIFARKAGEKRSLTMQAKKTAEKFAIEHCVEKVLNIYKEVRVKYESSLNLDDNAWRRTMRLIKAQVELMINMSRATGKALYYVPQSTTRRLTRKFSKGIKKT